MKELLTYIVQSLVEKSDEVSVTEREHGGETVFEVRVAPGDMGKVIGRQGRVVKEIRVLTNSNLNAPKNYESVGFVLYDRKENLGETAFSGDYLYYRIQLQ